MALTDSLISFWELEEASGTRVDSVVTSGNDLADNNTVTQAAGKVGNAAQFTAANSEYLSRADNASLSTGNIDFTFALWVNLASNAAAQAFIDKSDNATWEYEIFFSVAANRLAFYVENALSGGDTVTADNLGAPSISTWYFIVAWYDSVNDLLNIQVNNGTADSVSHTDGARDSAHAFRMGAQGGVTNFTNGLIDQVGFWKRVLTAQERTDLYNGGNGLSYAEIVGTAKRHLLPIMGVGF
jgi:hypothetical protein